MLSVVITLLMPLLNITIGKDSIIARNLILPIEKYGESINEDLDNIYTSKRKGRINHGNNDYEEENFGAKANVVKDTKSPTVQTVMLNPIEKNNADKKTNWLSILLVVYFSGVVLFLIRFIANFVWIFGYALRNKSQQISGMNVFRIEKNTSPFSFLNLIFISNKDYPETELAKIISHETVHIQQKHSLDLILFELLLVFQWFNPFVWFYKRAVKINHEYLADLGTLQSGVNLPDYQYSLLNQVLRENNFEITSNYNFSVKKRIAMMIKKRSPKLAMLKLIIALPILIFLFSAFAFCTGSNEQVVEHNQSNKSITDKDTTVKRVDVPVEYLKLIEGEYVSTNQMRNQQRQIVFTEALGTLYGYDNGYSYKIIPVGDGKFINIDDQASLEFDTKNKNEIKMLLFGKIHLNKVKLKNGERANRSMGFTLLNTLLKDGIPAALSYYKVAKDSTNYFVTVDDMNLAGYALMQANKTKEAAVIFKLNAELFPNSFNVYDSYAEVLMLLGDKNLAMENYKKSVKLNPGSVNGIKRLKELGVNTDSLIKIVKVPVDYLKLLEGEYVSTNEPNRVRRILFTEKQGVMHGWDYGYSYKLIPMGNGKFINPDDGESLVFDTKNKNAISLLLFGKINLNKTEWKESGINLKKDSIKLAKEILLKYCGDYVDERMIPLSVIIKGESLYRHMYNGFGDERLIPISNNKFVYDDFSGRTMEFWTGKDGKDLSVTISAMEGKFTYNKKK